MLIGLAIVPHSVCADPPDGYPFIAYDEGLRAARDSGKKIFVYFGRYGCGWCEKTNKESFSNPALRQRYIDRYVLVYADSESGQRLTLPSGERITERELGARLKVFATPVFLYFESDGTLIFRAPGFKTVKDFEDFDRYVSGGHYKTQGFLQFMGDNP